MNENEKDEVMSDSEEELSESIDTFATDLGELTEKEEDEEDYSEDEELIEEDEEEYPEEDEESTEDNGDGKEDAKPKEESEKAPEPIGESEAERKYKALLRQGRKTLKTLGIEVEKDEDVLTEFQRICAEAEGKSVEEYRFKKDLEDIQNAYPSAKAYKHLKDLPNVKRFVELMATGRVSAVEAFKLSHPGEAEAEIVKGVKQSQLNDTKTHIRSNIPRKSGAERPISTSEMREYRAMFEDLSDKEIHDLFRRTQKS